MLDEDIISLKKMHEDKVLHWRIIFRISLLCVYSIIFLAIGSYHFFAHDLNFFVTIAVFSVGFFLGFFLISRMFGIYWDEKRGMITSGRVDFFGVCMIILYAAIRYWLNNVLDYVLHPGAFKLSSLAFCLIAGIMVGRFVATIITIQIVHAENLPDKKSS